jgi:hypothetical protein
MGMVARANAAPITLTFEGVGNEASIFNFYNGGTDDQGHSGPDYGIAFFFGAYGLIDRDAGVGLATSPTRLLGRPSCSSRMAAP